MAINSVKLVSAGRKASGTIDSRSYVVVWFVIVNSAYDGPCTVGNAPGIPLRYAPYVGYEHVADPVALCTRVEVEQDGGDGEYRKWRVTATFDTNWGQNEQPDTENPEDDPPIFWVETEFATKKVTKTWDGQDIKNAAGQLIDGLERFDAVETWVWEKNHNAINRALWNEYQNTVNNGGFHELGPKEGLLHIIVPKATYRNGVPYWRVQYRVRINKDGWPVNPRDVGTAVKNAAGKLERPVDEKGNPMDGEVPLKADGTQQRDPTAAPRYIGKKDLYEPKNFNSLGLT